MSFLKGLIPRKDPPVVPSVMPPAAAQMIIGGQLPVLQIDQLLLRKGELCHYADRAIFEKRIVNKKRVRKNNGYSMPGLFKGTRVYMGGGTTDTVDDVRHELIKGALYITNQRVVFVSDHDGFDRRISELVAVTSYANCVDLQYSKETMRLFVPDGNLPNIVLRSV